jgi:hypothetical protein
MWSGKAPYLAMTSIGMNEWQRHQDGSLFQTVNGLLTTASPMAGPLHCGRPGSKPSMAIEARHQTQAPVELIRFPGTAISRSRNPADESRHVLRFASLELRVMSRREVSPCGTRAGRGG